MTTTTPSGRRVLTANLRAEWTKLRTVRSTMWTLLVTVALTVGLGALICSARVSRWNRLDPGERLHFDPTAFSLNGLFLAQLAIGVLGVLVMTSEYATGQIRATLGATPQRLVVLAAKVLVFAAVTAVVGLLACVAAFGAGQAIFTAKHVGTSLRDLTVARAVVGGALYLTALGLLGVGLGAIFRRTAAAITALVGLLLIVPILVNFLPSPWNDDVARFLPGDAGRQIIRVIPPGGNVLSPWAGFVVLCAYSAVAIGVGAVLLLRRDA